MTLIGSDALKIKLSSIMVENQATALAFYTDVLGFNKSKDIPVGEFRWLTVVSPEATRTWSWFLSPTRTPPRKLFRKRCFSKASRSQRLKWKMWKQGRID